MDLAVRSTGRQGAESGICLCDVIIAVFSLLVLQSIWLFSTDPCAGLVVLLRHVLLRHIVETS